MKMSVASFSPPAIEDYDISITVRNYISEMTRDDEVIEYDDGDVAIVGDTFQIFEAQKNLQQILRLACHGDGW